jgi:hypothetical protein
VTIIIIVHLVEVTIHATVSMIAIMMTIIVIVNLAHQGVTVTVVVRMNVGYHVHTQEVVNIILMMNLMRDVTVVVVIEAVVTVMMGMVVVVVDLHLVVDQVRELILEDTAKEMEDKMITMMEEEIVVVILSIMMIMKEHQDVDMIVIILTTKVVVVVSVVIQVEEDEVVTEVIIILPNHQKVLLHQPCLELMWKAKQINLLLEKNQELDQKVLMEKHGKNQGVVAGWIVTTTMKRIAN